MAAVAQVEVALVGQVDEPAGGADDDLDAGAEGLDLGLVGPAAEDDGDAHGQALGRGRQVLGDLERKLTGRGDDEGLRLARGLELVVPGLTGRHDALHERDAEAEGLARPGLGLADDVGPLQGDGQRHGLDREGVGDPGAREGGADLGLDAEVGEGLISHYAADPSRDGG